MAKQSWKQQMYQQIANSQVQQVMQQRDQDLQMAQSLIAQYQPNNDDLALAQSLISQYQPQQTAPVQPISAAPKQQSIPSLRQEGVNKAVERRQRLSKLEGTASKKEDKKAAFINKLAGIGDEVNEALLPEVEALSTISDIPVKETAKPTAKPDNAVDYSARYSAAPQINEKAKGGKEWNKAVTDTLNQLNSREQRYINQLTAAQNADRKKQEVQAKQNVEAVPEEVVKQYAEKKGVSIEAARAEIEDSIKKASAMNTSLQAPGGANEVTQQLTQEAQANSAEQKRLAAQKQYTPYEAWGLATGKAVSDVVNGPVYLAGKLLGKDWDLYSDIDRERYAQSKEQHPTASNLGTMSGMALAGYAAGGGTGGRAVASEGLPTAAEAFNATQGEALLNGAGKTEALLRGLGVAGRQTLANAGRDILRTDLATDIIPTLANDIAEGKSTGEVVGNTALNTLLNGAFNSVGDIASLIKPVRNSLGGATTKAALNEALDSALEGNTRYAFDDVDDVVRNATRQAEEATQNIENIAKQMPEIPENVPVRPGTAAPVSPAIENEAEAMAKAMDAEETAKAIEAPKVAEPEIPKLLSDDMEAQLNYDFENLGDSYYGNRAAIKASLENKDFSIPNTVINDVPGKNGKMQYEVYDLDSKRKIKTYASRKAAEKAQAEYIAGDALKQKAIKAFDDLDGAIYRYEQAAYNSADVEEVNTAKKAVEAARKRYERAMKEYDPSYYDAVASKDFGDRIARPYYTRNPAAENPVDDALIDDMVNDWVQTDVNDPNRFVRDAQPDSTNVYRGVNDVPGAEPLQTFAEGPTKGDWKTSKAYKTFERMGYGDALKEEDFAYRVFHADEQRALAAERYKDSENLAQDLLNRDYSEFDEADIKAIYPEMEALHNNGDRDSLRTLDRLAKKSAAVERESGRILQAKQEFSNTIGAALQDAHKAQDDFVLDPWRSKNKKAREGNSRIAKALADMGHKKTVKEVNLTHEQIKNGVIAELNREVGSVEKYFNDNDIEFLTRLAEDKSIPVWQITSEIEHKLNTGSWYTLDESVDIPKPTNSKLQSALNSLVTETIRAENQKPSLAQIVEEVRNTLGKESAEFEGLFTEDDINYLANLINEGATKEELAEALDLKLATGNFGITDKTLQEVNNIFKQISHYDPNSRQFVEGQAEAYRLLANEILPNATLKEKFEAWRYIAMLGNPKTMLRNFIGNKTFNVVTGISNNVAAIAEAGIDRAAKALGGEGIQRTKAVLNPSTDRNLIKACAEDADASRYRQIIGSKYEKMSKDTLRRSKSVFNSKIAQLYEKVTDAGISDYSAVKEKYSTSLAGYMKANGMSTDIFKAEEELRNLRNLSETRLLSDAEKARVATLSNQVQELEKARDYALKQAEYATFHEENKIASVLSKWSRTSKEEGTGIGHILLEGMVPFKKTPANVLRSGVEYSPLGAIDSIRKTGKLIYENTGVRKGNLADVYKNKAGKEVARTLASDVIDSWSKTLTGTGLTALGFFLYNKGILHSSDPDTKYQDELEGHQNYAIEINGKSYTIDWAAPTVMPLMVGAEIAKLWDSTGKGDEDFYNNIDGYVEAANRIADPLIETSMLQGVRDTLETAATYAQNNEAVNILPLLGYNVATGYATQGIPTLGGQIARTIDPTRRSSYTDKEGVAGVLDKQLKKQMNKIPGISMLNQPYINTYGEEQQNGPFENPIARLGYQMLSPGYLTNINETGADKISREAYAVSKNANTLPKWQSKFKDAEGNRVSPEDYTTASKAYGVANREIRDGLANDEWFNSLEGSQKEEIVKGINTIAEHVGNAAIDPEYSKDSKPYNAYKDGGFQGLKEYWKEQVSKNKAKESGLSSTSNASKAIQEDMVNGNEEAAQQKVDAAVSLQNLGLSKPGPTYTYYNAQTVIPGLTTEDFAKTYKTIDSDGNQGIKQDEVIAYLNSQKITSESEANKIWSAYGSSEWKSIPKLENGKWVKKKK